MGKHKILGVVAVLVSALALTIGTASALRAQPAVVTFKVQNLGLADCGLSFDMVSPAGQLLGTGVSCIKSVDGCQFAAGCLDTVHATFTLALEGGTLTLPVVLNERWLTDAKVRQIDTGTVIAGGGDFAGANGSLFCAGTVQFTATSVVPNILCIVHLA